MRQSLRSTLTELGGMPCWKERLQRSWLFIGSNVRGEPQQVNCTVLCIMESAGGKAARSSGKIGKSIFTMISGQVLT